MKYIKPLLTVLLFSFFIISCSKKNKLGKLIPKDAIVVVDINTKSLSSKLSWDDLKQTYWYQQLISDSSHAGKVKPFLNDPSKMGIDLKDNIILFVQKSSAAASFVAEGSIKNSKDFANFISTMHPGGTASKEGNLNIFKSDKGVIGWNNERFILVAGTPDSPKNYKMPGDSATTDSTINFTPKQPISSDSLLAVCKNIFSLKENNSLSGNERFSDLLNEDGDVHFWINNYEVYKSSAQQMPGAMGMVNLDKLLVDNIGVATVSFDDGKITVKNKWYAGKELSDILKSSSGNLNTEMIKRNASPNPAVVFAMHFDPENFLGIIRLTGLDGFANLFLGQKGLSLQDIAKATKGDIFFSVSNVTLKKDTANAKPLNGNDSIHKFNMQPDATFLFSVSVNDKNIFNKITDIGSTMGKGMTQKTTFSKTDDKYYALSNSQEAVNNYFSGTQSNPPFLDKISGHPMGMFVDLQMLLKSVQPTVTDTAALGLYNLNLSMWNNIYSTGGEYKDGGLVYNTEINLLDKSTNSLKQLNKLIDQMSRIAIDQRRKNRQRWSDSTQLKAPPSDTIK
jgi:hypothetical protein